MNVLNAKKAKRARRAFFAWRRLGLTCDCFPDSWRCEDFNNKYLRKLKHKALNWSLENNPTEADYIKYKPGKCTKCRRPEGEKP